jgi:RNA polymerase sigma-70 factor (ECF subfamily)
MGSDGDDASALSAAHDRHSDQRLARLYREQASRLQRRVGARIRSTDEAGDLVHDAFARLLGSASVRELRKPEAFLNRIMRNLLIDRARRLTHKAIHVPLEGADEPATPPAQADAVEIAELREQYRTAVEALPDRMRSVFVLHRIEGFSYKEIAVQLDISTRTVEWHVAQAIVRISKGLDAL